jgi:hypothetical protein
MVGVEWKVDRLGDVDEIGNGLLQSQKLKVLGGQDVVWRRRAPESVYKIFSKLLMNTRGELTLHHNDGTFDLLRIESRDCNIGQVCAVICSRNFTRREHHDLIQLDSYLQRTSWWTYRRSWSGPKLGVPPELLLERSLARIIMIKQLRKESRASGIHRCSGDHIRGFIFRINRRDQSSKVEELIGSTKRGQQRNARKN